MSLNCSNWRLERPFFRCRDVSGHNLVLKLTLITPTLVHRSPVPTMGTKLLPLSFTRLNLAFKVLIITDSQIKVFVGMPLQGLGSNFAAPRPLPLSQQEVVRRGKGELKPWRHREYRHNLFRSKLILIHEQQRIKVPQVWVSKVVKFRTVYGHQSSVVETRYVLRAKV